MYRTVAITALAGSLLLPAGVPSAAADKATHGPVKRVLLLSIDGMHALDFSNCATGIAGVNGGSPYCPVLAALGDHGVTYTQAATSKPSDSFPGLTALVTGGTPRSTGAYYDVSYDRALSPPAKTTPYGIAGGACPGTVGTQIGFDEQIDKDLTLLNAGGGINPDYLPRDPKKNCAPVYPHTFIRVNTLFEVVKDAGGYTAWTDKHQSYELVKGHSGTGVDDFYAPEVNSIPVALPQVTLVKCNPLPDQTHVSASDAWTDSFANIQCYDALKVQSILNEIDGLDHAGLKKEPVPTVFGMNFQAVSVGQKLNEKSISKKGGYLDSVGTPSAALLAQIKFVDKMIGSMVAELKSHKLYDSTMIIISAKHGQSPVDPQRLLRIPGDVAADKAPSDVLTASGFTVAQALEDDVSLLWLDTAAAATTADAVAALETSAAVIGAAGGEFYSGALLKQMFGATDSRVPNIIVQPDVGVVYTGGTKKLAEHGGFAHQDTNVMMLVATAQGEAATIVSPVQTMQVAPTILSALGLDPTDLKAVQQEGTQVLPGLGLHRRERD